MKSTFDRNETFFEINDQRKNRCGGPLHRFELRKQNQCDIRIACGHAQFANLMLFQPHRTQITTDHFKE